MTSFRYSNIDVSIRRQIVSGIEKRNYREKEPFEVLIATYNKLFDTVAELRHETLQLTIQNEKIRQESLQAIQASSSETKAVEKSSVIEQKIFSLQEELTNLHRRKGEHAQQIVDLTSKVQEAEKALALKEAKLEEAEHTIFVLADERKRMETDLAETEAVNQTLHDEHQALQIAFASMEEKLKILHFENIELVQRLMTYKSQDAEILNRENENFVKIKQAQMLKELEEAANEVKIVNADKQVGQSREMLVMARCKGVASLQQLAMGSLATCIGREVDWLASNEKLNDLEIPVHLKEELEAFF